MNYLFHLLIYLSIYAVVAWSLNIIMGYCGLFTLAHAAFFGIGSYAYALITLKFHVGFVPGLFGAGVVAALLSLLLSLPSWRFKGDLFLLASLAIQAGVYNVIQNWASMDAPVGTWKNLTNGPTGIGGVPGPDLFGFRGQTTGEVAVVALIFATVAGGLCWILLSTPWGRLLQAVRDDELAARSLGKNSRLAKVQAIAISCGIVASAGAIYSAYVGFVDPSVAALDQSILMISMVLVGGVGNFKGPLVGAVTLVCLPELLRFFHFPDAMAAQIRLLCYGLLLGLLVHRRPQGLAGNYRF